MFRTLAAPFVAYPMWRYVTPLLAGIPFIDEQVMALMPAFMFYALTFVLYTIPVGYLVARVVSRNLKVGNRL